MNGYLLAGGLLAAAGAVWHGAGGELMLLRHIDEAGLARATAGDPASMRRLLRVVWHLVTVTLAAAAVGLLASGDTALARVIAIVFTAYVAVAVLLVIDRPRLFVRLPQWIVLASVAALAWLGSRAPHPAADDRSAVLAVLDRQRDAWNRGDIAAYMDGYARTPALVFTSGGRIRRGWDETLRAYQTRYGSAPATMGHLDFEILDTQLAGTAGAVVLGRWRLTGTPQAGSGVFSVVLERGPGGWRIVHDHTSSDPPP